MLEKSRFKRATIILITTWLTIFAVIPNLLVIAVSFLERDETRFVSFAFTAENYTRILDPAYISIFTDSLWLAVTATALCLVIGYPFAFILARAEKRLRPLLLMLVIIPFWTNSLIRTYALITILNVNGLANELFLGLGLIDEPMQILYTNWAVFIGLTYTLLPFMILPLYASIEKLDVRLIEAARDLGAGSMQTFVKVSLPLTLPGIIAGCILVFLPALGMFYITDILGGAKSMLLGNFIKNQFLSARDWPFGATASVVMTGLMAVMLLAYYQSLRFLKGRVFS